MSDESFNNFIDEDQLSIADQIALYKELVRLLEKDIDNSNLENSREGWTTWTLLAAIAAAVGIILSQTRSLDEIPRDTLKITVVFVLLFQFGVSAFNVLSGVGSLTKEGRLIDSKQAFKGRRILFYLRALVLLIVAMIVSSLDYPIWIKATSIILIFLPVVYVIFTLFLTAYTQRPLGNNPKYRRANPIFAVLFLGVILIAVLLLGSGLQFPVGPQASAAYTFGLCLAAIVVLIEILVSIITPADKINDFQDLKDDIVFRRVDDLNEALNRYKILKEGKSLFDEMKPDLDRIMVYLYREDEIYSEQDKIIKKIRELIPLVSDAENVVKDKNEQITILSNAFGSYSQQINGLITLVNREVPEFNTKLGKATAACGDDDAMKMVSNLMIQKLSDLSRKAEKTDADRSKLFTDLGDPKLEPEALNERRSD